MTVAFIERPPTGAEVEKLRLILSTYQDGSGMLAVGNGKTLPGWRDFERAVAISLNGVALESKAIFDVYLASPSRPGTNFGISCKMRKMLRQVDKDGRVTIELSNAAGEFWDCLKPEGINQQNYESYAETVGKLLIERVESWHNKVDISHGGTVITDQSIFLVLQYNMRTGEYQLFQYPIDLPDPAGLKWSVQGRRLIGKYNDLVLIEWYGFSGGQLKYYPHQSIAMWKSKRFHLEPLPADYEAGILNKVAAYWPETWAQIKEHV